MDWSRARACSTLSRTLDHVGPFARSIEDLALILGVIAGYDPRDPDTRPVATADFAKTAVEKWPLTPRLAFVRTPIWDKADATTRAAFEGLAERLGGACITIDLPDRFAGAWDAQRTIMAADMAHNLGSIVDRGGDAVSKQLRDFVEEGRKVSASRYLAALDQRARFAGGIRRSVRRMQCDHHAGDPRGGAERTR